MSESSVTSTLSEHLRCWAKNVHDSVSSPGVYLFGSLVYKNGQQFEADTSDVDLVVTIPEELTTAPQRCQWVVSLFTHKSQLELDLLQLLRRDGRAPICSIVAVTATEVRADIHKDGASQFFTSNLFRSLLMSDVVDGPIPGAGTETISDHQISSTLRFAQKYRNLFLGVSANHTRRLNDWEGKDPVPKDIMRHAAMAEGAHSNNKQPGRSFDLKIGLDYLSDHIYDHRDRSTAYYALNDWLSARRGARGSEGDATRLKPEQYLLLAEIIYDLGIDALPNAEARRGRLIPEKSGGLSLPLEGKTTANGSISAHPVALPVAITISKEFSLMGSIDELKSVVEEATHNLKWRLEPAFLVSYEELADVSDTTSNSKMEVPPNKRKLLVKKRDRAFWLEQVRSTVERGVRLILYYQNTLFAKDVGRQDDLIVALNSFLRRVALTRAHSIGGTFEAYVYVENERNFRVNFSMSAKSRNQLLRSCGFRDLLQLAGDNQPLIAVGQNALARYFVPQLVFDYLAKTQLGARTIDQETEELIFSLSQWQLGVH
jgi:hypothetical protein